MKGCRVACPFTIETAHKTPGRKLALSDSDGLVSRTMAVEKDTEMKDAADPPKSKPNQASNKKKMKNGKPVVEEEELSEEDLELKNRLELFVERAKDSDAGIQVNQLLHVALVWLRP